MSQAARSSFGSAAHHQETSLEEIRLAVHRARFAAEQWGNLPARQRVGYLKRFRKRLLSRLDDVVAVALAETGKPRFNLMGEIFHGADLCRHLERRTARWLRPEQRRTGWFVHKRAMLLYRPYGVVATITPYNYPIALFLGPVLQGLAAGNAVIAKPSEWTTATSIVLSRLMHDAGFSDDLVQVVPGGPTTARALAASGVDKVFFTGGREGGLAVYRAAAESLTPAVLELGGNDAAVVLDDADIERAAHAIVWGAFFNAGQSCIAVERCYVQRDVADDFVRRVVELTRRLVVRPLNSADEADVDVGPLRSLEQVQRLSELIDDAKRKGAKIHTGGKADLARRMFEPTVLTRVDHSMRLMQEETFGPILPIQQFDTEEDAIELANDSDLGLGASVWSRNRKRARRVADRLDVGGVVINDALIHFGIASLPFGGWKQSGFGRTNGKEGFAEFVQSKSMVVHRFGPRIEWQWFPHEQKYRMLARACRWIFG